MPALGVMERNKILLKLLLYALFIYKPNGLSWAVSDHLYLFFIHQGHKVVDKVAVIQIKRQKGASCYQQYHFPYWSLYMSADTYRSMIPNSCLTVLSFEKKIFYLFLSSTTNLIKSTAEHFIVDVFFCLFGQSTEA